MCQYFARFISSTTVIDGQLTSSSEFLSGSVALKKGECYNILIEYIHFIDEPYVLLQWRYDKMPSPEPNSSKIIFHQRNIDNSATIGSSPLCIIPSPGIDTTTTGIDGDNQSCIALDECTFIRRKS